VRLVPGRRLRPEATLRDRPARVGRAAGAGVLAAAAVLVWTLVPAEEARAQPALIGYTALSDANVADMVVDSIAGLAGEHPLSEADLPEDSSELETGPFGTALAAVFWPGATGGNLGSLSGELPIPSQLAPLLSKLNDPVRAQTFYPAGPEHASYPPGASGGVVEMTSSATPTGVTARAGITDVSSALLSIQGVQGNSSATATAKAQASASGTFSGASILGGLITVGATSSTATATSDGISVSGSATTHLGAVTIGGLPVSVGTDGLKIGPAGAGGLTSLTDPAVSLLNSVASLLGLKITTLPVTKTGQAPAEKVTSGGIQVSFQLPSSLSLSLNCSFLPSALSQLSTLCTLPGFLQGLSVTLTLGRVSAEAVATPPFSTPGGSLPGSPSAPASPSGSSSSTGSSSGSTALATTGSIAAPSPSGGSSQPTSAMPTYSTPSGSASPASPAGTTPATVASAVPISLSTPVKAALVALLLVLAAAIGAGLWKVGNNLEGRADASSCPLDKEPR
jgi:hypothetical protein